MKFATSLHDKVPAGYKVFDNVGKSNESRETIYSFDAPQIMYGVDINGSAHMYSPPPGSKGKQTATLTITYDPTASGVEKEKGASLNASFFSSIDPEKAKTGNAILRGLAERLKQKGYEAEILSVSTSELHALEVKIPDNTNNPLAHYEEVAAVVQKAVRDYDEGKKPFGALKEDFAFLAPLARLPAAKDWRQEVGKQAGEAASAVSEDALKKLLEKYFPVGKPVVAQQHELCATELKTLMGKGQNPG